MEKKINGRILVHLIIQWCEQNNIHPDDFDMWFAHELLEKMEEK